MNILKSLSLVVYDIDVTTRSNDIMLWPTNAILQRRVSAVFATLPKLVYFTQCNVWIEVYASGTVIRALL